MAPRRIQIPLSEGRRQRLGDIARARGMSPAAVVREALDLDLAQAPVDATEALRSTFGVVPYAEAPPREEWETRAARVWES